MIKNVTMNQLLISNHGPYDWLANAGYGLIMMVLILVVVDPEYGHNSRGDGEC